MQTINFYTTFPFRLRGIIKYRRLIIDLFKKEKVGLASINYIFCTDSELLKLNKTYLQHNYNTDILTFDLSHSNQAKSGEIHISIDRVKANAKLYGVTFSNELTRVIIHGALHLCGYKDKTKREITEMRNKEDIYLRLWENVRFT